MSHPTRHLPPFKNPLVTSVKICSCRNRTALDREEASVYFWEWNHPLNFGVLPENTTPNNTVIPTKTITRTARSKSRSTNVNATAPSNRWRYILAGKQKQTSQDPLCSLSQLPMTLRFFLLRWTWECVRPITYALCCGYFQGCYRYIKKIFQQLEVIH